MKTSLFAILVASSNAVQLRDISAEGSQLNLATTSADVTGGNDNCYDSVKDEYIDGNCGAKDTNYAEAYAEG